MSEPDFMNEILPLPDRMHPASPKLPASSLASSLASSMPPARRNNRVRLDTTSVPYEGHVMVDVETMGRKPGCAILSIGAVRFNPDEDLGSESGSAKSTHLQGKNHFYMVINNLDSSARGFSSDIDTMRWWKKQSIWQDLSMAIINSDVSVPQAATSFSEFLNKSHSGGGVNLWANSPSFDIQIMRAMFKAVDQKFPVDYRKEMDFRTIMELAYPHRDDRPGRSSELSSLPMHHALGDAVNQAQQLIMAGQKLGIAQSSDRELLPQRSTSSDMYNGGRHMMLEVKTLGKSKGCGLLSIGAVIFDPTGRNPIEQDASNRFHVVLSNFDMGNYGFTSEPETVRWWKSQQIWSQLCMETVQSGVPLVRALKQLTEFIQKKGPEKVWANSPTFDIEMLRDAYTATQLPFPIEYRMEMDYRTAMELIYPDRNNRPHAQQADGMLAHHALGDAVGQSRALVTGLSRLTLDLTALSTPRQLPSPSPGQAAKDQTTTRRRGSLRLG